MPADTRDSLMVHTMLRREFAALPHLVRDVADGDLERAQLLNDHLEFLAGVLIGHHGAEDEWMWPKLLERAGALVLPVIDRVKLQHACIEELSDRVMAATDAWCRSNADQAGRDELACSLDELTALLHEHMATEEATALPLAAHYMNDAEWSEMGCHAGAGMPAGTMDLIFGMTLYEAAADDVAEILSALPPDLRAILIDEGTRVYAGYAERIHGTATPRRARLPG